MSLPHLVLLVVAAAASLIATGVCSSTTGDMVCPLPNGNAESCVCSTSRGIIDLTALSNRDGTARFTKVADSWNYYYEFNPCQAFVSDGYCINIHACQEVSFDHGIHYNIADQGTEQIMISREKGPYLHYTGPGGREVKVFLNCNHSLTDGKEKLTTTGDSKKRLTYLFDLHSCHACPGGCYSNAGSRAGIAGFVLILIVGVGFLAYIVIGATVLKFHLGMKGMEVIPHAHFWMDLPNLIKDGCMFCLELCHLNRRRNVKQYIIVETERNVCQQL